MSLMQHSFSSIAAQQGSLGQFSDRLQQTSERHATHSKEKMQSANMEISVQQQQLWVTQTSVYD